MSKPVEDKSIEIPEHILGKLLTPSEVRMLKNRWQIIQHLQEGLTIRSIAEKVKVGTDTVVRVARMMEKGEVRKVLNKSQGQIKTRTPWIFGKNS